MRKISEIVKVFENSNEMFDDVIIRDVIDCIIDEETNPSNEEIINLYYSIEADIEAENAINEMEDDYECGFDPYEGCYTYDC